ncbi:vacuolar fusion protein MON1 [Gautieria morchelliformis]|nr:vacuolar fusion protein MON1 [Gautieria morchelliformis]
MLSVFPFTGEQFPQRQYFVFTDAGKPVFVSRPPNATEDLAAITGITSALISVFADSTLIPSQDSPSTPDKLRCINAGSTRITFFLRPPLYYVCVSGWKEPESVARMHLEYLHLQILSVLTASQLRRIFERRTNFDLRRLLEGTETFLHTLISRLQSTLALSTTLSALSSLRIDSSLRNRAGDALVPSSKSGGRLDILYTLLISSDSVITIVRPRKHSVHPTDLNILLNTLHTPSVAANPASWLPICLPRYNPQGFVHAYVCFLEHEPLEPSHNQQSPQPDDKDWKENTGKIGTSYESSGYLGGLVLVTVSGGGDFDAVKKWSDGVVKVLDTTGLMPMLRTAVKAAPYGCSELGIPGLRHFLYKSRVHVQVTSPTWDEEYQSQDDQRRLITIYQKVHDAIHAKSGQGSTLKLQYIRTDKEAVLGWITQPFELYVALSPRLPKTVAVGAANGVARWAKREEARLFLRDAPVF